jgi:hypothetical protein
MRKMVFLFAAATLYGLATDAMAQRRFAEYKELSELEFKAREGLHDRKRRVETTREEYAAGIVTTSEYILEEWLAEDRWRLFTRSSNVVETVEYDTIVVGHFRYERKGQGPWTKIDLRNAGVGSGTGSGGGMGAGCTVEQLTVEPVFLGSFPARMFEYLTVSNGKGGVVLHEDRTWIGDNGDLLQKESVSALLSPRKPLSRSLVKYEFDPKLTISEPIS